MSMMLTLLKRLTTEYGIASIPLSVFNDHNLDNQSITILFC